MGVDTILGPIYRIYAPQGRPLTLPGPDGLYALARAAAFDHEQCFGEFRDFSSHDPFSLPELLQILEEIEKFGRMDR